MTEDAAGHIDPVIAYLADKFPQAGRDHVAEVVWDVYNRLDADATVSDHLPALTQHHAQERLRAETAG